MAKIQMQGMSQYIRELENVAWATGDVCRAAVKAGAGIVADEIRRGIESLRTNPDVYALVAYNKNYATYITVKQKRGLLDSLGIARIQESYGIVSTKIGFDGYNEIETDRWPQGQPNAMIARACESGSIAMFKQPFMRPSVNRSKRAAEYAMELAADKKLKQVTGGNDNG